RSLAPCASASSPSNETAPESGQSRPAMIRSSVVLPEPDGPSNASSSPLATLRSTPSSAANDPNLFTMFLTSIATRDLSFVKMPFENGLCHQRDQRQHRQQRRDRERGNELIFIVENLDQQRHGVGLAANVPGYHRHRAEFAHRARVAQQYAIEHAPFDIGQSDAEEGLQAG